MPGFIKTPAGERKWKAIKHSVAKERGKSVDDFTDSDWAIVNAAWHKSEEEMEKSLNLKIKGMKGASIPSATKMPKAKSMPDAMDKPSKFWKSEEAKHPTIQKLKDFLLKKHKK